MKTRPFKMYYREPLKSYGPEALASAAATGEERAERCLK